MGLKALNRQKNMLFIMSKKSGSRCELKNINKIKYKLSRNISYYRSNSYIGDPDSDSRLSSDNELEELRHPTERNQLNKLDHVVTYNIEKNKNQHNDAI